MPQSKTTNRISRPRLQRAERREGFAPLPAVSEPQLAAAFSIGLDLAEGKAAGHSKRVCNISMVIAKVLGLSAEERVAVFYGALFHDLGVTAASCAVCRSVGIDEEGLFGDSPLQPPEHQADDWHLEDVSAVLHAIHSHPAAGAEAALQLGLPEAVADAIRNHHERWDGDGYPQGLREDEIPLAARIIAVGDMLESVVAANPNPLAIRRDIVASLLPFVGRALAPALVLLAKAAMKDDRFWLNLHGEPVAEYVESPDLAGQDDALDRYTAFFSRLADGKREHTANHSARTAAVAKAIAEALALSRNHAKRIELAALLHDIGMLGIPARILAKPDILSVTEMEVVRRHPENAEAVVGAIPGLSDVAAWLRSHHERPDAKGYPDMLSGEDIAIEARIIAVAAAYVALLSKRPHRPALKKVDAKNVLLGSAGGQLDEELVKLVCDLDLTA